MEIFEATIALLGAALLLSGVAGRLAVPYPSLLVLGGLLFGFLHILPSVELDPAIAFALFLPPILFEASVTTSWRDFRTYLVAILSLAVLLVGVSTYVVAVVADRLIPELPLGAAFVLGAIVSPPDAAAATAVLRKMRLPRSVVTIIEGESLINDAAALVIYNLAVAAVSTGHFSAPAALLSLARSVTISIALGLLIGWGLSRLAARIADPLISILASFLVAFATYRVAEHLEISGVLAVVTLGLVCAWRVPTVLTPDTRLNGEAVWRLVIFALNALAFVLIGLQLPMIVAELPGYSVTTLAIDGGVIAATAIAVRLVWVMAAWLLQRIPPLGRRLPHPVNWRQALIVGWSGMRGLISLAAALALPHTIGNGEPFPARALVLFLSFSVILATLVVQGLSLGALIRALGLGEDSAVAEEERLARTETANAAIAALDKLAENPAMPHDVINQARMLYISRLNQLHEQDSAEVIAHSNAGLLYVVRLAAIAAERTALLALRRRRAIGDGPLNTIQHELDLLETVLRRRGPKSLVAADLDLSDATLAELTSMVQK